MVAEQIPLAERSEQAIREYFEARPGWGVQKLDSGADFRICHNADCFLCEVKAVQSMHANFPYAPEHYFIEERDRRRQAIQKWMEENPERQLIVCQEDWQFLQGDETEFRRKHRRRRRNTEDAFTRFRDAMQGYFTESRINHLPYRVRLDSDDLYVPNPTERNELFKWLEDEVTGIDRGNYDRRWSVDKIGSVAFYSTFYRIHEPDHQDDLASKYQLLVMGPLPIDQLQVEIHSYGGLNIDAIDQNIRGRRKALHQLRSSARQEEDPYIPRVVALAFMSGIGFDWPQLSDYITWLLQETPSLSAVAVLEWTFDGDIVRPSFVVYHNPWLEDVRPLSVDAFCDRWSVQLSPMMV